MQNIDFTNRINRGSPRAAPFMSGATVHADPVSPGAASGGGSLKRRNRSTILVLALLILAFTVGMMAGIQLGYLRHVDATLVKNPDPDPDANTAKRGDSTSFSNVGSADANSPHAKEALADHLDGRYLVRVGTFAPRAAELLAGRLNNHPDLAQSKPVRCKNVSEVKPERYLAFRVKLEDGSNRQNVFLGCFRSEDAARDALTTAMNSGIPGLSAARLYEID